jgi:hypothetical protein
LVKCPLTNKEIEEGECVVIVDVCDGAVRERILSRQITENKNWKDICKKCEFHEN